MPPYAFSPLAKRLLPLIWITVAWPAVADTPSSATVRQFDPMIITATRQEQRLGDVAGNVSVVEEQRIDRENINSIQDLVRFEPGVSVGGTGSRFGLTGFTIRGIGGNRVLTQVDGVGMPDAFDFGPFMNARRNYVDIDTIKRVEIIRGPASSLYGSDALGGAVSFLTKDAGDYLDEGDDTYARLKTGFDGSDKSWLRSATLAGRQGQLDAMLHIGRRTGDELSTHSGKGGAGNGRGKANPADTRTDNLLTKLGWNYSNDGRLQLTYERFKDDSQAKLLSNHGYDPTSFATTLTDQADDRVERERFSLEHEQTLNLALADQLHWRLSYQDSKTRQFTQQLRQPASGQQYRERDSRYQEKEWSLGVQLEKNLEQASIRHRILYGVDVKRLKNEDLRTGWQRTVATGVVSNDLPTSDFPNPTVLEYAAFVQDSIHIGDWTIIPGLRYDRYSLDPHVTRNYLNSAATNPNPARYRDQAVSPKLAVIYQIDDAHRVYAQYAAGFRAPQAVSIFGEFENPMRGYRTLANPNLEAETSNSYEIGLRGEYTQGSFGVTAFYNRYDDFIEQVSVPPTNPAFRLDYQSINLDKVTVYGIEANGELFLDSFGLPDGTRARSSLAYSRGKNYESNQPLNSIDPLKGVFGLGYDAPNGRFGSELIMTLVDGQNRIDKSVIANQYKPSGYALFDLTGYWQASETLAINVGLFNLADKKYWNWADARGLTATSPALDRYTQPGRYAAVNLTWEI